MSEIKRKINKDEHLKYSQKQKELEIARQNMNTFSAKKSIYQRNNMEELNYFQNNLNNNLRKAARSQNQESKQQKLKEIEVREFNKNQILHKHQKNDNFILKDKDSQIYGCKNINSVQNGELQLDPFLEAGDRR